MRAKADGAHIEAAQVVRVHHALAAVLSEGLPRAVCIVLHRVLPAAPIPPQINLQHASKLDRQGICHSDALTAVPAPLVHYDNALVKSTVCMHEQDHASGTTLQHNIECSSTTGLQGVSEPDSAQVQGPTSTSWGSGWNCSSQFWPLPAACSCHSHCPGPQTTL